MGQMFVTAEVVDLLHPGWHFTYRLPDSLLRLFQLQLHFRCHGGSTCSNIGEHDKIIPPGDIFLDVMDGFVTYAGLEIRS